MFLSLLPGLGQMYAGSFFKGLLFMIGTGACVAFHEEMPSILPLAYWLFGLWDARMTAHDRNFRVSKGRTGTTGATHGDWMLLLGTLGLGALYFILPVTAGMVMEPWMLWGSFIVILILSALLGRGGKNVKTT
jgi:hypothetical protein